MNKKEISMPTEGTVLTELTKVKDSPNYILRPICRSIGGKMYCVNHEHFMENNAEQREHTKAGEHILVWYCFEHGFESVK